MLLLRYYLVDFSDVLAVELEGGCQVTWLPRERRMLETFSRETGKSSLSALSLSSSQANSSSSSSSTSSKSGETRYAAPEPSCC